MTNYTSIQQGDHDSNNDTDSLTRPTTGATRTIRMSNKHKTLMGGFVTVVASLAVITSGTGTDNSNSIVTLDSATSATAAAVVVATTAAAAAVAVVRDCTFTECFASPCDKKLAPFVCELWNGGPMGGCSPTPWLVDTCDDSCSLAQCHLLPIPPTTKTCQDVKCGEDDTWCESPQLCGEETPYQCTNGAGRFGCSALPLQWTLLSSDTTCADCCDITTCEGCRTSKWYLSYLASNNGSGNDAAVCVEKYYTEEASMVANAEHLQQINPTTTLALQQGVLCQDRTEVDYSHLLKQYVPPKKDTTTTYGNCWIKHFSNDE